MHPTPPPDLAAVARAAATAPDTGALARTVLPLLAEAVAAAPDPAAAAQVVVAGGALVDAAMQRLDATEALAELEERVATAQRLAGMGDYDWHIASDTNRWSDELFRIYGHEPQSFEVTYERFMAQVHPDDRERIQQVHRTAYETGGDYEMVERIVRPDGEVRHLASNGQVVVGDDGTPVRMRGTCVDITARVRAQEAGRRSDERLRALSQASPDGILVLDRAQAVQEANRAAVELLGGDPVGQDVGVVLGRASRVPQVGHALRATGLDGRALRVDVRSAPLGEEGGTAVFVRDAGPRLAAEALTAEWREAQVRRRQALEINDNVVQGLTAAGYALEQGAVDAAARHVARTLGAARQMMDDLLAPLAGDDLQPGDLVRSTPSTLVREPSPQVGGRAVDAAPPRRAAGDGPGPHRVLLVDDSEDVRVLLRMTLERLDGDGRGYEVVGEAADGEEGVEAAARLQPELVLLDLAMPRVDGLQALPRIRQAVPDVRVVVLSGFDGDVMSQRAIDAGADRYVEKGTALADLAAVVGDVLAAAGG